MVKSMNAAIAGLKAHQTRLDVLGNNIANVNTWGYKMRTTNFQDSVYVNLKNGQSGSDAPAVGTLGGINTSQLGYGAVVSSVSTNFGTSSGQYTGNDLDCRIDGPGFFIVGPYNNTTLSTQIEIQGSDRPGIDLSSGGAYFSKVGIFNPDANGYLVDDSGNYVYGYAPVNQTKDENGNVTMNYEQLVPIRVPLSEDPDSNGEIYTVTSWRIGQDGTVVGTTVDKQIITIGQIAVANVENPNGLNQKSGYYYEVGNNSGRIVGMATTEATGLISSGFLEMSNTDIAFDFATMITTQRGYQANTKIITVTDEILEQLVNMKR